MWAKIVSNAPRVSDGSPALLTWRPKAPWKQGDAGTAG